MNENSDSNNEITETPQNDPITTETAEPIEGDGNSTLDVRADAETAQKMTSFENEGTDDATSPMTIADIGNTTNDLAQEAIKAMARKAEEDRLLREEAEEVAERSVFKDGMALRLDSSDSATPIVVDVSKDLIVGRADNVTSYTPEIDLTPHGAYRLGLSRRHALIRRKEDGLIVKDLSSRNGTYVNGEQVLAGDTLPIRDGDELRFGNLAMRVRFEYKS